MKTYWAMYKNNGETLLTLLGDRLSLVLNEILKQVDRRGYWYSNKVNREQIGEKLGISDITLKQHIKKLKDKDILVRPDSSVRGIYRINPAILEERVVK